MNKYIIQGAIALALVVTFIVDKSLAGVISFFNFYSFTIVILLILVNIKTHRTFIFNFFVFGILCDWYNRAFLGTSILISIISLYLFYVFKIRFSSNKALMTLLNTIFAYFLSGAFWGFSSYLDVRNIIMSILIALSVSYLWLKE